MKSRVPTVPIALLVMALVMVPFSGRAQVADTLEVNQVVTGAGDVNPPTVPTGLSATAVSDTEIDLAWTASTDDVAVVGYQVFRDSMQIATTTLTSYADTGLLPETTYAYNVTAFDFVGNTSAQSATATATTLTPPPLGGGGAASRVLSILDVSVVPSVTTAVITWQTNRPAQATVLWGATPDYELGALAAADPATTRTAHLKNLTPNTRFYFLVEATDERGARRQFAGMFTTDALPDSEPPGAVTNFRATGRADNVALSWKNPPDADFALVRIVRSDRFFPDDPFAGSVVYENAGTQVIDDSVLPGVTYYYTAFARDAAGNYASGAIASARRSAPSEPPVSIPLPFEEFPDARVIPPEIAHLVLSDFDFIQHDTRLSFLGDTIPVDGGASLTVSLDYDKVPEVLKTIAVTLVDPEDHTKAFSFLLRITSSKTAYTASVAPLVRGGRYEMVITVLDVEHQRLKALSGNLLVSAEEDRSDATRTRLWWYVSLGIGLLVLLLIVVLIVRRSRRRHRYEYYKAQE